MRRRLSVILRANCLRVIYCLGAQPAPFRAALRSVPRCAPLRSWVRLSSLSQSASVIIGWLEVDGLLKTDLYRSIPSCQREPEQVAPPGTRRQLVALANLRCDDSALPGARKTGSAGGLGWDSHQSPGFYSSLRIHHKDRFLESLHLSWK